MTDDLITRLKAMQDTGRRTLGGGNVGVGPDGKTTISSSYGNEPILALRNPDGPEAAEKLGVLELQLSDAREETKKLWALLADRAAVHLNMLRGGIAKPLPINVWHLYGNEALIAAMPDSARALLETGR